EHGGDIRYLRAAELPEQRGRLVVLFQFDHAGLPSTRCPSSVPPWITLSARYWMQRKYSGASELFRQARAADGQTRRTEPSATSMHSPSSRNWPRPPTTTYTSSFCWCLC